jgi:esterase/lipase
LKKGIFLFFAIIMALLITLLLGPRVPVDTAVKDVRVPNDIDSWLADKENSIPGIRPGLEKKISWSRGPGIRTEYAIILFHGFPASRLELDPAWERIAQAIDANIFYTRLKGHGRDADALKNVTVNDWLQDAWEAWKIGLRLGENVIIAGHSTGSQLAAWLASREDTDPAIVIMSCANYKPADKNAPLLLLPWGNILTRLVIGEYRDHKPGKEYARQFATFPHHSSALLDMMALVRLGNKLDLESIDTPLLSIYNPNDTMVDNDAIIRAFSRWGAYDRILSAFQAPDHGLAGNIQSPGTTDRFVDLVIKHLYVRDMGTFYE